MRNIYAYKVLGSLVAITRREILANVDSQMHQVYLHLIKLLCIDDRFNTSHWIKEITEMLGRISSYVYKGKSVDYKTLEKIIKNNVDYKTHDRIYKKTLQHYCKHITNNKNKVTVFDISNKELVKTIVDFLHDQAQIIAQETYDIVEAREVLIELQKQYADRETKTLTLKELK